MMRGSATSGRWEMGTCALQASRRRRAFERRAPSGSRIQRSVVASADDRRPYDPAAKPSVLASAKLAARKQSLEQKLRELTAQPSQFVRQHGRTGRTIEPRLRRHH